MGILEAIIKMILIGNNSDGLPAAKKTRKESEELFICLTCLEIPCACKEENHENFADIL